MEAGALPPQRPRSLAVLNPIALAIPVFFVAMGAELALSWRRGRLSGERPAWRFVDAVGDLACGISSQVTGLVLSAVVAAGLYVAVYDAAALFVLPGDNPWVWLGAFVGVDFFYYWWHRASHRVNVLWAAHVVHHQSEDYNLAVALRQAIFTPLTSIPFYLPLAVLGVPPVVYLTCQALNTLYQFWIHTRLVGRLGSIDLVFNTPTHHRCHHGINPGLIDKNHGGVFIVFDRLFGTFVEEREEPVYGVVEGFESANVLRANLDPLAKLARLSAAVQGWDRLRVWFAPPEWRPASLGGPVEIPEPGPTPRWRPEAGAALGTYVGVWLVLASGGLFGLLLGVGGWPIARTAALGVALLWTTVGWGGLLDRTAWARPAEWARLVALPALAVPFGTPAVLVAAAVAVLSAGAFFRLGRSPQR